MKKSIDLKESFYEDEENGGWIDACPELIYTQGETRDETVTNLQESLEAWFIDCIEQIVKRGGHP